MRRPLAIDLYAGLGGWAEGLLAEGYNVSAARDAQLTQLWAASVSTLQIARIHATRNRRPASRPSSWS